MSTRNDWISSSLEEVYFLDSAMNKSTTTSTTTLNIMKVFQLFFSLSSHPQVLCFLSSPMSLFPHPMKSFFVCLIFQFLQMSLLCKFILIWSERAKKEHFWGKEFESLLPSKFTQATFIIPLYSLRSKTICGKTHTESVGVPGLW